MELQTERTTLLARRAGRYREAMPLPGLRGHFRCVWTNWFPEDHAGKIAVVPDGCVDLLWCDDRFVAVGPDMTAAHPALKPGTTVIGLRFQPGAAANWLGMPMTEIVGSEVPMGDVWGQKAHDIAEAMQEALVPRSRAALLQELLLPKVPDVEPPARDAAVMFRLLQSGVGCEEGIMSPLRNKLDLSERTLRRRSCHLFGYGPKTLDRILRLQRFQALSGTGRTAGLADTALAAGYADQAHLSREVQALCGMTAGDFVRQLAD